MDGLRNVQQLVEHWWQFFNYCFNQNPAALMCDSFWSKWIGAFIAIGVVLTAFGVWKYIDYRRKWAAAERAQWLREQVDEVGIREATWDGDKAFQTDLPDEELLQRIKAGIEQRKREASTPAPSSGLTAP